MSAVFYPNGDGDTFWYPPGFCLGSILDAFRRPWTQLWDHGVLWGRFWRSLKQVWELMVLHWLFRVGPESWATRKLGVITWSGVPKQLTSYLQQQTRDHQTAISLPLNCNSRPETTKRLFTCKPLADSRGTGSAGLLPASAACGTLQAGAGGLWCSA